MLARAFGPQPARLPNLHRRARVEAQALARQHGIEIERLDSGMNVWPPKAFALPDPWDGDHFCEDWCQACRMVRAYAEGLAKGPGECSPPASV